MQATAEEEADEADAEKYHQTSPELLKEQVQANTTYTDTENARVMLIERTGTDAETYTDRETVPGGGGNARAGAASANGDGQGMKQTVGRKVASGQSPNGQASPIPSPCREKVSAKPTDEGPHR
jgi:hypothetical protein